MKIMTGLCFFVFLTAAAIYCLPLFHVEHAQSTISTHDRIESKDPIKRAFFDKDIHYESTPLNPEPQEYLNERVDPRSPINPNATTLQDLAKVNSEDESDLNRRNRTFDQNFVPGGVRTHSDSDYY